MKNNFTALLLAYTRDKKKEKYIWYPYITEKEIPLLREEIEDEKNYDYQNPGITVYNLSGQAHRQDYDNWKNALINKTQTFKRKEIIFNEGNIKELEPKGYIIYIKETNHNIDNS